MNLSSVNPVFFIAKRVAVRGRAGAGDGGGRRVSLMEMDVIFRRPLTPTLSPRRGEREPQCVTSKRATANWPVLLPRPFGEGWGEGPGPLSKHELVMHQPRLLQTS